MDDRGHGTHVAGIIASTYNSTTGTRGVYNNVELISVKILDENGKGDIADLVLAMNYIKSLTGDDAVQVVNISAGCNAVGNYMDVFTELYDAISSYPGLVVCSAGNKNEEFSENDIFPAGLGCYNIISVAASNINDERWYNDSTEGSNYGVNAVDLFAPGENILSCTPIEKCENNTCSNTFNIGTEFIDGYHYVSGTSQAAPFVTGVVAYLLALNDDINVQKIKEIKEIIEESGDTCTNEDQFGESIFDMCSSGKRLNAYNAYIALMKTTNHSLHNAYYTCTTTGHIFHCIDCGYHTDAEPHEFYIESVSSSGTVVGCRDCDYTINCDDQPCYISNGSTGHWVDCSCACYSFLEDHTLVLDQLSGDLYGHIIRCPICEFSYTEGHSWVWNGITQLYVCSDCGYTTDEDYVPGIMSLPDPELEAYLASLSDEELEEFIASLPEDQVARVTALLPSDDEHLTE